MLRYEDLSSIAEVPIVPVDELPDESDELLRAMPEIRRSVGPAPGDELGFRAILERPEALSEAWWRAASARRRRAKLAKRRRRTLDAA